jgi:hypothetical protein
MIRLFQLIFLLLTMHCSAQDANSKASKAYKQVYETMHIAFEKHNDTITEQTAFVVLRLVQNKVDSVQVWSVNDQADKDKLAYLINPLMGLTFTGLSSINFLMIPVRITDARIENPIRSDEIFFDSFSRAFRNKVSKNVILLRAVILDVLPVIYDKRPEPVDMH